MKLIDSRVISVRTARIELVLVDGTRHSFDLAEPVVGTVTVGEAEIDASSLGSPGACVPGRRLVMADLTGSLAPTQRWGREPCPTCSTGPIRNTIGGICPTCGVDHFGGAK